MILRKPYAFLIKNFRLIHFVFTILVGFLFFKGNDILNFLVDYINNNGIIVESYMLENLFPTTIIISFIAILLLNVVMIWLLYIKEKKVFFYIINTIIYAALAVLFYYTFTQVKIMQISLIDTRIIRALRDFYLIASVLQMISIVMYAFRATGFDIKKFDFGKDLVALNVTDTDNEEFEVQVSVDIDKINRNRRKFFRHLKYFYFENKLVSNTIIVGTIVLLLLSVYFITKDKRPQYKQFQEITTGNYNFKIGNVYLTDKDKNNKIIDKKKTFIILEVYIKNTGTIKNKLNISRFELMVDNHRYYHNYEYNKYFTDIGDGYYNEDLKKDYEKYLLIYPIKNSEAKKKIYLNYVDFTTEDVVNLKPQKLNNNVENFVVDKEIDFSNSILKDYKLSLNNKGIEDKFTLSYKYCITSKECFSAVEYVTPTISTNYDKTLLKVEAKLTLPEKYVNSYATTFESLCKNFGKIKYIIDGKEHIHSLTFDIIKSSKLKQENVYYIEVKNEVKNASNVSIIFELRNTTYEYILK